MLSHPRYWIKQMAEDNRVYNYLGLCARAGKLVSGADAVRAMLTKGDALVLVVTHDCSRNTLDKLLCSADRGNRKGKRAPVMYSYGNSDKPGEAIGKPARTVAATGDRGFAEGLAKLLDGCVEEEKD